MPFDIDPSYKEVPERIADLKAKHPDARLRPVNVDEPFRIVTVGDKIFIVYAAACYLSPDDPLPGIGVAWEPFPGRTPYTKDSELMNAETSAWGRAIVAALRSESKAIASANEVRNRKADQEAAPAPTNRRAQGTVRKAPNQTTPDPETGEIPNTDLAAMKPAELNAALKAAGLQLGGNADEMRARLVGHTASLVSANGASNGTAPDDERPF